MRLIDAATAADYLRETKRIEPRESVRVHELSGGVSNIVLYVARGKSGEADFVLKQARPQLRVPQPWFCSVERIRREVAVLRACDRVLAAADSAEAAQAGVHLKVCIPRVLFEDREDYLFAMSAAPRRHVVWKSELLAERLDPRISTACGWLLGFLHAGTWNDTQLSAELSDQTFFDDLRVDPYYRQIARVHDDLQAPVRALIRSLAESRSSLVHGDYSPKNMLVWNKTLMLVDFEVGHFGDPAFDIGFFLSHLVLKSFRSPRLGHLYTELIDGFWRAYLQQVDRVIDLDQRDRLIHRGITNLAACALARVDGKSQVDYLGKPGVRDRVRQFARHVLLSSVSTWGELIPLLEQSRE